MPYKEPQWMEKVLKTIIMMECYGAMEECGIPKEKAYIIYEVGKA